MFYAINIGWQTQLQKEFSKAVVALIHCTDSNWLQMSLACAWSD
jgi:hypothetical protein